MVEKEVPFEQQIEQLIEVLETRPRDAQEEIRWQETRFIRNVAPLAWLDCFNLASGAMPVVLTALSEFKAVADKRQSLENVVGSLPERVRNTIKDLRANNFLASCFRQAMVGAEGGIYAKQTALDALYDIPILKVPLDRLKRIADAEVAFNKINETVGGQAVSILHPETKGEYSLGQFLSLLYFRVLLTYVTLKELHPKIGELRPIRTSSLKPEEFSQWSPKDFRLSDDDYSGLLQDWRDIIPESVIPCQANELPSVGEIMAGVQALLRETKKLPEVGKCIREYDKFGLSEFYL